MFENNSYLFVLDFDGTAFDTFEKSPSGIGVHEAYEMAIEEIFGEEGLRVFNDEGGLNNGAPEEIVDIILDNSRISLFQKAEKCFDEKHKTLRRLVPQGKGAPLEWISYNEILLRKTISELLVLIKMSFLYDQIGSKFNDNRIWPQPCKGFLEFVSAVEELRKDGIDIQIAILSSGHEKFIKKTFMAHNLSPPDIIVSDDDLRGQAYPESVERRVKPSSYLFDMVQARWIGNGVLFSEYSRHIELIMESRKRMMYFGDDIHKDGGLAKNAGVRFGLYGTDKIKFFGFNSTSFYFPNWEEIGNQLLTEHSRKLLKEGADIKRLLL